MRYLWQNFWVKLFQRLLMKKVDTIKYTKEKKIKEIEPKVSIREREYIIFHKRRIVSESTFLSRRMYEFETLAVRLCQGVSTL